MIRHTLARSGFLAALGVLALTAALSATRPAMGADERPRLVVGIEDVAYFPHYQFDDGELTGFARAVFDAFADDAGFELVYRPLAVHDLVGAMVAGRVDLLYPDNPAWTQSVKGDAPVVYSAGVAAFRDGAVVRPTRVGFGIGALKTLGTVTGFTAWGYTERIEAGTIDLVEVADFVALVRSGVAGDVDAIYANPVVVDHVLRRHLNRPGALVLDSKLPHVEGAYHVSTTARPDVVRAFDAWMAANADTVAQMKASFGLAKN